jgi:ABC-type sugar transport system ATPase subunit
MVNVRLDKITKRFEGAKNALEQLSFTLPAGDILAIVGPSGCGKSTLLKTVAGLEMPDSGSIFFDGHDVTEVKPQARGVGMVFQDYALYPSQKGKGNLAYFFEVHKRTQAEQEQRVRETAELMGVGFETLLGQTSGTLSGGEQQRVAIARCIVRDPTLFLMDEPIVNLDAKLRERTRLEMKKLLKKFAITTMYVTHDQQEAIFMGDHVAVMNHGRLEQLGSFDDLYYSPVNQFVATFIGAPAMSVFKGVLNRNEFTTNDVNWSLPSHVAAQLPQGELTLGIRPDGWQRETSGAIMTVRHIERLPSERASYVHGTLAGQSVAVLSTLEQQEVGSLNITPKGELLYTFKPTGETCFHPMPLENLF